jgi:acetyltransferase-like isoleucine patch superfamily enzyme
VKIFIGAEHRVDWITTYPFSSLDPKFAHIPGHPHTKGDVVIGNDVWIGWGATILSGVTIGDGAVIGASSLVTKDVAPYTIVGGNPAKLVRARFSDAHIRALLDLKWWDWDMERIHANMDLLLSGNIDALVARAGATS